MLTYEKEPIFILGNPRSGTRMLATLMNKHPDVLITDEFKLFEELARFLDKVGYTKSKKLPSWSKDRSGFSAGILADLTPYLIEDRPYNVRLFGNKTPSAVFSIDAIERIFGENVKYIYCIRHPSKVLLSLKNMPWNKRSVPENLDRMFKSVSILNEKLATRKVLVVKIDKQNQAGDLSGLADDLFEFADIEMHENVSAYLETGDLRVNATERHIGLAARMQFSMSEIEWLSASMKYQRICDQFGYDPDRLV